MGTVEQTLQHAAARCGGFPTFARRLDLSDVMIFRQLGYGFWDAGVQTGVCWTLLSGSFHELWHPHRSYKIEVASDGREIRISMFWNHGLSVFHTHLCTECARSVKETVLPTPTDPSFKKRQYWPLKRTAAYLCNLGVS